MEETNTTESVESVHNTSGMFGERFSEMFTAGEIVQTENSYKSENINVNVSHYSEDGVIYNIAEIYIRDLKYFKTAFGGEAFKKSTEKLPVLAERHNAIIAISGDHYGARAKGVVVRNGVMYRNTKFEDIGILTDRGELITMPASKYDPDSLTEYGAWQVWCFGPELLDNGTVKTKFNSNVTRANPRTAIGCVEPGHYFFVVIDGRGFQICVVFRGVNTNSRCRDTCRKRQYRRQRNGCQLSSFHFGPPDYCFSAFLLFLLYRLCQDFVFSVPISKLSAFLLFHLCQDFILAVLHC